MSPYPLRVRSQGPGLLVLERCSCQSQGSGIWARILSCAPCSETRPKRSLWGEQRSTGSHSFDARSVPVHRGENGRQGHSGLLEESGSRIRIKPSARQPAHHWTIRYEDLTENPKMFVEAIAAEVLGRPIPCSFLQGNRAAVKVQHILAGNPDKLERSDLVIEKRNPVLPRTTNLAVSLLTFPLTLRYGYVWAHNRWLAPIRFPFADEFQKRSGL